MTKKIMFAIALLLSSACAFAQGTVTLTPSITSGDGQITIPTMSWSTSPALTTGTPCTASAVPALAGWSGAKAGSGTVTNLTIPQNTRLVLDCVFPGDSIVTFTWTNPTTNTDGTPYTNPKLVRIKHTFNAALTTNPAVAATGETHTDVLQTPTPSTMRTITGVTQVGTLRGAAYAQNTNDAWSVASNAATKVFTGSFTVNQAVDITIRSVPGPITGFGAQ